MRRHRPTLHAFVASTVVAVAACRASHRQGGTSSESPAAQPAATSSPDGSGAAAPAPGAPARASTSAGVAAATEIDAAVPIPPPLPPPPVPTTPAVQLIGRFDTRDPSGPKCAWPGCRIVARFRGTAVSASLRELLADWMEGTPSEWDVSIDGALRPKVVTVPNETHRFALAAGLTDGEHVVELYKRSEAQTGVTQLVGLDFEGGTLLPPPQRKARRLEIIGDSAASGFGVEGAAVGPDCPGVQWAAEWENFHVSFGAVLGELLDAEVMGTVYSGKGIVKDIAPADTDTMPLIFPRSDPLDPKALWDFNSYTPDAIVVMMGGNDFAIGQPVDEGPATPAEFTNGYDAFVATIRQTYPAAYVLLVISGSVSDSEPAGRNSRANIIAGVSEVIARRRAGGDRRVASAEPPIAQPSELTGCNGHGTAAYHRRIATVLAPSIRIAAGW